MNSSKNKISMYHRWYRKRLQTNKQTSRQADRLIYTKININLPPRWHRKILLPTKATDGKNHTQIVSLFTLGSPVFTRLTFQQYSIYFMLQFLHRFPHSVHQSLFILLDSRGPRLHSNNLAFYVFTCKMCTFTLRREEPLLSVLDSVSAAGPTVNVIGPARQTYPKSL